MIEQTELIVKKWNYQAPANFSEAEEKLTSILSFDVMKKRAASKKGISCRFTSRFVYEKESILEYVAEDSYVIDLQDIIDIDELHTMIRNSYSKFKEKFDLRKTGTLLQDTSITPLDVTLYDLEPVLALLK